MNTTSLLNYIFYFIISSKSSTPISPTSKLCTTRNWKFSATDNFKCTAIANFKTEIDKLFPNLLHFLNPEASKSYLKNFKQRCVPLLA